MVSPASCLLARSSNPLRQQAGGRGVGTPRHPVDRESIGGIRLHIGGSVGLCGWDGLLFGLVAPDDDFEPLRTLCAAAVANCDFHAVSTELSLGRMPLDGAFP